MSTTNEQIVKDFLHGWGPDWEGIKANWDKYVADDFVWFQGGLAFQSGLPEGRGKAECLEWMTGLNDILKDDGGYGSVEFEMVNVIASGDVVVTERIDNNLTGTGNSIGGRTPVLGIFEVRDGNIVSWRDYFDPRGFLDYFPAGD